MNIEEAKENGEKLAKVASKIDEKNPRKIFPITFYKSIGNFSGNVGMSLIRGGKKQFLACPTLNSYKLYELPSLRIAIQGPSFPHSVRAIVGNNEQVFLAVKNIIYKMHYYHIEACLEGHDSSITSLLIAGNLLLSSDKNGNIFS